MSGAVFPKESLFRICHWLAPYAFRRWAELLQVLLAMLGTVALDILKPWPAVILIDHVLMHKPLPATLAQVLPYLPWTASHQDLISWSVGAMVLVYLLGWALGMAAAFANINFGQRLIFDLATDLFSHLQRLSLRFHASKAVGDNIRRLTVDSGCVATILRDALLPVLTSCVSLLAMFSIMWEIDHLLTLLAVAVAPLMVLAFRLYALPLTERSWRRQEAEGKTYNILEQSLSAIGLIQAFGREDDARRKLHLANEVALDAAMSEVTAQLEFKNLIGAASALGTAGIMWVGARHALAGDLTIGEIILFLTYLGSLYAPIESVMYSSSTVKSAAGSARRVLEILETDREVYDRPGARALAKVTGRVCFENVSFSYDAERLVLKSISFEAEPGQTIAIVGPSGGGKSTLVSLIPRFFDPVEGRILVDGHDVRDLQLRSLRDQVSVVLQEPFLFPLSISENIAYGRPDATVTEIEAAARAANAHEFIMRLPEGYSTMVGERGATLSGGERQRLSIARALLKNAPILILDEPTSALDSETEAQVLEAVDRLMEGRSTFIIAHRLSTVRAADRIVVLEDGRLVESGVHAELLSRQELYTRLYDLQFSHQQRVSI